MASKESIDSRRPRWKYLRRLVLLLMLAAIPLWLNGPGLRWLGPRIAGHYLEKAGLRGEFTLEGSLTGGLTVRNFRLESDTSLAVLSLDRALPVYQIRELLAGRVRGIEIDGLHAELRLGLENPDADENKPSFDPEALVAALRQARGRIVPLSLDLRNFSLRAVRDGAVVFDLAPSRLRHQADDPVFHLDLAALSTAGGRVWPSQESLITWNPDSLALDRLDPWPGVGLRALAVSLPDEGSPSADAELWLNDAVFVLTASLESGSVSADLREGRLNSRWIAENFKIEMPVHAELSSLSLNLENLLPDPSNVTGSARLLLENVSADEWNAPELSLDLALLPDRATLAASGQSSGSGFSIDVEAPWSGVGGKFNPDAVRGTFRVDDVAGLAATLAERFKAIDAQAPAPQSMADGSFAISLDQLKPVQAEARLTLKPAISEESAVLFSKIRWQKGSAIQTELETEGVKLKATWQAEDGSYQGEAVFDGFQSARVARWLALLRVKPGAGFGLTGNWSGKGDVKVGTHDGSLTLGDFRLIRDGVPSIEGAGSITYDWPQGFSAERLVVRSGKQSISADAGMADGFLTLRGLRWLDDGNELLTGSANLPLPADFSKWRTGMAHETRPILLDVQSAVLPLVRLKDWLPAAAKIDSRASGRINLKLAGTYAKPEVDALVEIRDLRSTGQKDLPPADLDLKIKARDELISLDGAITAPDFPAATLVASMPFRPGEWIEHPESLAGETITARADLPRLEVSRFTSLIPGVKKLSGILTGHVEVAGELTKPAMKGQLDLKDVGLVMDTPDIPPLTGGAASLDLALDRITLRGLRATIAGGSLRGGGTLAIVNGKADAVDLRVTADHLPLLRNDSMIVRANADLRLSGKLPQAALTGNVGIVDSLFYRDIELLPIGTPFVTPSAAALPRIDTPKNPASGMPERVRDWTLDVRVRSQNPFLVRGNFAEGQLTGDVRIAGTLGNPQPDGEVTVKDLKAALPFSTLHVRKGTLRFTPAGGFDPALELRGTADPRPYQVNAFVYGRASDPQLMLTSSPPLPENEIMTLLATGTTTRGLEDPQAASSRALQLFAEELRRGRFAVGKRLRPLLGLLDKVDFTIAEADPYTNESFSTATLALTDRWFLSAGMGEEGDSRMMVIWRLTFH